MKLEIAAKAEADIRSIAAYTRKHYGLNQANRYLDALYQLMEKIAVQPGLGHFRRDIPGACKAITSGRHVVVYTVKNDTVYVARILHDQADFKNHDLGQ
ncbi:MAG: type II toxin-antitoxin system RelE/ParE family toxin [Holosporales bacterium]